jgi:hypothetical protein
MKKVIALFTLLVAFTSCTEDVKFNNPAFQGLKDDVLWRAIDSRATIGADGSLTIKAYTDNEIVTINTSSVNTGTYILGTTNQANKASYVLSSGTENLDYQTIPVSGTVQNLTLYAGGSGYTGAASVTTTGGTGTGLKVNTKVNSSGVVVEVRVSVPGNGYIGGDLITISGGNGNAKFVISEGEVRIKEYDPTNMTVTGEFRFNAKNTNNNPLGGETLNFQQGVFYKVPIYPSL